MVYIGEDGKVVCNHLNPKNMLDKMRLMCKGKNEPLPEVYKQFNVETKDGKNMKFFNKLLGDSISSIIEVKMKVIWILFLVEILLILSMDKSRA